MKTMKQISIWKLIKSPLVSRETAIKNRLKDAAEKRAIDLFTIERRDNTDYITFKGVKITTLDDVNLCDRLSEYRHNYVSECMKNGELI